MGIQLNGITGDAIIPGDVGIGGTLTYEDVTNVDSVGIITARTGVIVGSGVTLNATGVIATGVVTATSFVGSGANLTSLPAQATISNNADNRVITGGSGVNLNGEAGLTYNGQALNVNSVTSENNAFRVYNTTTGATTYQINGEGNSFIGHLYPRTTDNLDIGFVSGYKWRDLILSGGVRFGSSSANDYLDDYEQGTFTPIFDYDTGASGITHSQQQGQYTKIGNTCWFQLRIGLSASGSGTHNAIVRGLPFTPVVSTVNHTMSTVHPTSGINLQGSEYMIFCQIQSNHLYMYRYDCGGTSGGSYANLGDSEFDNTSVFNIEGFFFTEAP